jgi:peptide/nickel transport system ATP-binding protein
MTQRDSGDVVLNISGLRITARSESGAAQAIVDDVSFTLNRGEVLGLIGESGAGKSTIGLAALGYTRRGCAVTGGHVYFKGEDVFQLPPESRRRLRGHGVAYIAQSAAAAFNPAMTILDQVCEVSIRQGLMTPSAAKATAIKLFHELELPNPETFGLRYPHQVSGGQLQRAMAAMAMAANPSVLIFDEPTTALDVTTQLEVLASFRKLIREHGTAALYITHDLAVVAQMADRIMVLRHGKMIELGPSSQILEQPREAYTRQLVADRIAARDFAATGGSAEAPLLALDHVVASYAKVRKVINDVSFTIDKGDTLGIVGESGSGKSTLARVIVGLLPRESGEIQFKGTSLPAAVSDRGKDLLRRIQLIYQMPDVALNPRQTIGSIIGRPVQFYFNRTAAETRTRVCELLRMIDLPETFIDRYPGELSGGQKQRVCIARALAAEPDIIICDEVTSALDQLVGEEILRLLKRLQDELGVAYLFITHDLGTVKRVANKLAVMLNGQIVAIGPTQEVFSPPFHPYTQLLLSSVPEMRRDWLDDVLASRERRPDAGAAVRLREMPGE